MLEYDVVIIGGGIAGAMAAVSAGRLGVSVLLVEEQGCLGGALTSSGTGPMMTFHAGEKQVIKGFTDELVERLKAKGLSVGHIVDSTGYTYTVTPFDSEGMKRELELMVLEAGCTILYHTMLSGVEKTGNTIDSLDLLSCGQHIKVKAKRYIETSGDADLLTLAGISYKNGRDKDNKNQPMTMNFKVRGVDTDKIRFLMSENPSLFPFLAPKAGIEKNAIRLSFSGFKDIMIKGIETGEITFDRDIVLIFETNTPKEAIVNMTRVNGYDPCTPFEISKAEEEGRRQVWELFYFLKKHIPGLENIELLSSGPNIGIRTSKRLQGKYIIKAQDLINETRFEDAIACFGYPIDIHSSDGVETNTTFLSDGAWYTVPYRSLITEEAVNLIVAGRLISSDFEAQASLRLSPCCGATGQAAGTAAALSVQFGCDFPSLPVKSLQEQLKKDGTFLE